jgi:hypothetical protein
MQSSLARQLAEVANALREIDVPFALIGGLALAAHGVSRGTRGVDLLVDADHGDAIDALLRRLSYQCRHRGEDAATCFRGDERLDDPRRTQDLEDIRALLRANGPSLDMEEVRDYFRLFDREAQLDELLREIR